MRTRFGIAIVVLTAALLFTGEWLAPLFAQRGAGAGNVGWRHPEFAGTGKVPGATLDLANKGDANALAFKWMWYMGMLRGPEEADSVATFELRKATGTISVKGQPCKTDDYRLQTNWQVGGERLIYSCTLPNGQKFSSVEVLSGEFAWDEDIPGAELVAGKGKATPNQSARIDRIIRMWANPWGAPKAVVLGGAASKAAVENGKAVINFPIPGVPGAMAKATLNADNQAERIEVRNGAVVHEFVYEKYDDYNPEDDRIQCYTPGRRVYRRDNAPVWDVNTVETHCGNLYIIMPVPDSVRKAAGR